MGMKITEERLYLLQNDAATKIDDLEKPTGEASGTKITITIPLQFWFMLKAIVIDDEPRGRNILLQLISQNFEHIKVVATAAGSDEGIKRIDMHKPDVVFLDVEMPGKNAFDML